MITLYPIEGFREGFVVEGHANYDEHGKDIVCSAVSSLALSVFMTINKYHITNYVKKEGLLAVHFIPELNTAFYMEVLLIGMEQLAYQYPKHITISEKEYDLDAREDF